MHAHEGKGMGDHAEEGACTKMAKPQTEANTNAAAVVKFYFLLVRLANT